jgi:hypothetical protein
MIPSGYRVLREGTYVSPNDLDRGTWLTPGSIVYVWEKQKPGRIAPVHETYVRFRDTMNQKRTGWISRYVKTVASKESLTRHGGSSPGDDRVPALDLLRANLDARHETQGSLTPDEWASNFGHLHVRTLIRFCQELNHRIKPDDDPIRAGMSLLLNREVKLMKTAKKTKKVATPNATKVAKKSKPESEGRTKTLDRSTGTLLLEALAKAPGRNKLIPLATRLANGEVLDKKALTTLRDGVNASAAEARASNKPKTAAALANANRQVRRLYRRA